MFAKGRESYDPLPPELTEADIAAHYFGIKYLPCLINSPLREDLHASFGLFSPDGNSVLYRDFATGEHGGLFSLLGKMWSCTYAQVINRISQEDFTKKVKFKKTSSFISRKHRNVTISIKERDWEEKDINYWDSFGISKEWLIFADVHPISYIFIKYDEDTIVQKADDLAYAFAEFKDDICTFKIYQPYNKAFKWRNNHNKSVISLWTKIPQKGRRVCICSSLKDALCLWANTNIPAIAPQGEGYSLSNRVVSELKERFGFVYICLDNDKAGIKYAKQMQSDTGFINIILPPFKGGKDISDLYKCLNSKTLFKKTILNLFKNAK